MSRFFRQADDSDSESESSEEELMSGSEDEKPSKPTAGGGRPVGMARFLKGAAGSSSSSSESDSDDDDDSDEDEGDKSDGEEEVKITIKSAKDKRLDEMEAVGKAMDNAIKINDWVAISTGMSASIFSFRSVLNMIGRVREAGSPHRAPDECRGTCTRFLHPHISEPRGISKCRAGERKGVERKGRKEEAEYCQFPSFEYHETASSENKQGVREGDSTSSAGTVYRHCFWNRRHFNIPRRIRKSLRRNSAFKRLLRFWLCRKRRRRRLTTRALTVRPMMSSLQLAKAGRRCYSQWRVSSRICS